MKIGRNDKCHCGSGKKYKKCCLEKDQEEAILEQRVKNVTRRDFISAPYKKCPNPECLANNAFGVSFLIEGSENYSRECIKCGHTERFRFPKIKKKVVYLDQFIISNLVKLLDKSHQSHAKIKSDPFWETLFIKLERAFRSQAVIFPDSFYHQDESLVGDIDFKIMKRLYEHFSSGKTLYPSFIVEKFQIVHHFESWLENKKAKFEFDPQSIAFDRNLHSWSVGMKVAIGGRPYPGQVESLKSNNASTRDRLKEAWERWKLEKDFGFTERVKEETSGLWKGIIEASKNFMIRKSDAMKKIAAGENYEMELDDFIPPQTEDLLADLNRVMRTKKIPQEKWLETIIKYFHDVDSLLEVPYIRISSVMFAGWAHRASFGSNSVPKSTTDVQFISSYLPYCDAIFMDNESASVIKELPKSAPEYLRLKEFPTKIFSLNNKQEFLDFLDKSVEEVPEEQIEVLKDINEGNYDEPYWEIIEREKRDILAQSNQNKP